MPTSLRDLRKRGRYLSRASECRLLVVIFPEETIPSWSRGGALFRNLVINHVIHHRGQLTVYLRLCDVPVPGMYGPSADEQ